MNLLQSGKSLSLAADKAGVDEKTARKYRDNGSVSFVMREHYKARFARSSFAIPTGSLVVVDQPPIWRE